MAKAGYDPAQALEFWKRIIAQEKGAKMPQFMSTHPNDAKRLQELAVFLPRPGDTTSPPRWPKARRRPKYLRRRHPRQPPPPQRSGRGFLPPDNSLPNLIPGA